MPTTESGIGAVRMRGLFGGETVERAAWWVDKIEAEAVAAERERIREALDNEIPAVGMTHGPRPGGDLFTRAVVLAIVNPEDTDA